MPILCVKKLLLYLPNYIYTQPLSSSVGMLVVSRVPELWTCEERSCIMHRRPMSQWIIGSCAQEKILYSMFLKKFVENFSIFPRICMFLHTHNILFFHFCKLSLRMRNCPIFIWRKKHDEPLLLLLYRKRTGCPWFDDHNYGAPCAIKVWYSFGWTRSRVTDFKLNN